jgi:hypothetical protein
MEGGGTLQISTTSSLIVSTVYKHAGGVELQAEPHIPGLLSWEQEVLHRGRAQWADPAGKITFQ